MKYFITVLTYICATTLNEIYEIQRIQQISSSLDGNMKTQVVIRILLNGFVNVSLLILNQNNFYDSLKFEILLILSLAFSQFRGGTTKARTHAHPRRDACMRLDENSLFRNEFTSAPTTTRREL